MKKIIKNDNYGFTAILVIMSIFVFSILAFCYKTSTASRNFEVNNFYNNWKYENKVVDLSKSVDEYSYITNTVPSLDADTELVITAKSFNMKIYIDDELIYTYEAPANSYLGKASGLYYVNIPLLKEYSNKEIKIEIDDVYHDGKATINDISYGSNILLKKFRRGLPSLIACITVIIIGLNIILLFPVLWFKKLTTTKTLYLGFFLLFVGIFMTSDSNLLQIIYGKEDFFHIVSELTMQIIVIPYSLFLGRVYKRSNRLLLHLVNTFTIVVFIIVNVLNVLNIYDFHQTVFLIHFEFVVIIFYTFYLIFGAFKRGNDLFEIHHSLYFLTIIIFTLMDVVTFYSGYYMGTSFFTRVGILLFVCLELFAVITEYSKMRENHVRSSFLSKLAYNDGLTDLYNRTSFNEDMEKGRSDGMIAVFDVNCLKKVNDTLGHSYGDELITTVAKAIYDNYSDIGKCYRIGGDEFVVITDDVYNKKDVDNHYKDMNTYFNNINNSGLRKYDINVAMGCSSIKTCKDIYVAFNKADARMYKTKLKMKKESKK